MNLARYLRDSWLEAVFGVGASALAWFVLDRSGVAGELAVLVSGMIALAFACVIAVGYLRRRHLYRDLAAFTEAAEDALWVAAVQEVPTDLEGMLFHDAVRAISKAANDEVARSQRHLREYREYVETWVHEAKSPLAAAHLMVENLRVELAEVPSVATAGEGEGASAADGVAGHAGDVAARAEDALARLVALEDELARTEGYVEQALYYARSEALDRDYLIRACRLDSLVSAALRANARVLIGAHVAPMLEGLDREVFTDEKWMGFVLGQVVQNSAKYARAGGGRIAFTARLVDGGTAAERVELAVRDDGPGVPAADLPRVFDKGFTGSAGRAGKRSTGIGLYLVRRLCGKMGVDVAAESVEGEFFQVTFGFPTNKFHYFEG